MAFFFVSFGHSVRFALTDSFFLLFLFPLWAHSTSLTESAHRVKKKKERRLAIQSCKIERCAHGQ
jgi:hypothetical protein